VGEVRCAWLVAHAPGHASSAEYTREPPAGAARRAVRRPKKRRGSRTSPFANPRLVGDDVQSDDKKKSFVLVPDTTLNGPEVLEENPLASAFTSQVFPTAKPPSESPLSNE
jgi:hypothetical protein